MGDGVVGGGCWGDGDVGGGCWGDGDVGEGMVLWTTLQNQLTFSNLTFGDYFLLCPLSPISSFSYLNSCTCVPLPPLP